MAQPHLVIVRDQYYIVNDINECPTNVPMVLVNNATLDTVLAELNNVYNRVKELEKCTTE